MKRVIWFVAVTLVVFIPALVYSGVGITVNPFVGFATVSMGDINDLLKEAEEEGVSVTKFGNAVVGGMSVGYQLLVDKNIKTTFGFGAQYLYPFSAKLDSQIVKVTFDSSLLSIVVTPRVEMSFDPFYVGVDLKTGYGFGNLNIKVDSSMFGISTNITYSGSSFVAEGSVVGGYNITKEISVELSVGYRHAVIPQIKDSEGKILEKYDGSEMKLDFSGLLVTLGAKVVF